MPKNSEPMSHRDVFVIATGFSLTATRDRDSSAQMGGDVGWNFARRSHSVVRSSPLLGHDLSV